MRRALLVTTGATLIVLLTPLAAAGACISEIDLVVGGGSARFDMQQVFDDQDAAELRAIVDQAVGNGDGRVSDPEVAAWQTAMTGAGQAAVTTCLDSWSDFMGGFVTQDGEVPGTLEDLRATMDLEGSRSTTAQDPLVLGFSGTLRYEVDGPDASVVVTPEAFEGVSEMMECIAPGHVESNYAQNPCGDDGSDPMPAMRRLAIRPGDGARIDEDTIQPAVARDAFDGTAIVMTDFVAEDTVTEVRFHLVEDESGFPWVWVAAAVAGLAGLAALFKAGGQRALFRFWWLVSVFGFTRIRRDQVLDHRRREEIMAAIESHPGVHLGALQRTLEIATGTLVHHLRVLERAGLVVVRRRSNRVHFVPAGYRGPIEAPRSALQVRLLETVRSVPGLSQSELAEKLGESRTTVAYNVRRLVADGRIEVRRKGRVARHFVAED